MKHKLLLCSFCMLLLFSCKKEKKAPDTKLYPISFKVSDFAQTYVPAGLGKTKTVTLATQATDPVPVQRLYYMLFDTYTTPYGEVKLITLQKSFPTDPGFGTINDNVAPGDYIAVFAGGPATLNILPDDVPRYYLTYTNRWDNFTCYWGDTFYKRIPIKVTPTGVNMGVSLDRITGRLDLVIKDAIPAGISRIIVSFTDTIALRAVDRLYRSDIPSVNGADNAISATDIGKTNYTITMNVLRNNIPFDVTVKYYNSSNPTGPISTKVIKNVACKMNTKTTLSGNLFTQSDGGFAITVNQDWNTLGVDF